jgi:hypothetical protein
MVLVEEQTFFKDCRQKVDQQQEVGFSIEHMPLIVIQSKFSKWPPKSKKRKEFAPTIVDCLDEVRSCQSKDN